MPDDPLDPAEIFHTWCPVPAQLLYTKQRHCITFIHPDDLRRPIRSTTLQEYENTSVRCYTLPLIAFQYGQGTIRWTIYYAWHEESKTLIVNCDDRVKAILNPILGL